jgi:hypothetical protein
MLGLRNRSPRTPKSAPVSVRPYLESLEERLCPTITNALYLSVTYAPNQQVILHGQLMGDHNTGQTINLGGAVNGTAMTDGQGNYSVTLKASQLGQVTASEANGQSNPASATLTSQVPTISSFTATCEGGGVWMFRGSVTGAPTQGEVVNLGGIPALDDQSVNVNPDGSFIVYATVSSGNGGCATAEAVDWWGETSEVATTSVPV